MVVLDRNTRKSLIVCIDVYTSLEKDTDAVFRALPIFPVGRGFPGIVKGGVERTLIGGIGVGLLVIELLQDEDFVAGHVRIVAPALVIIVLEVELHNGLVRNHPKAVELGLDHVFFLEGAAIEDTQRIVQEGVFHVDGPPEADCAIGVALRKGRVKFVIRSLELLADHVGFRISLELIWSQAVVLVDADPVKVRFGAGPTPEDGMLLVDFRKFGVFREQDFLDQSLDFLVINLGNVRFFIRIVFVPVFDFGGCLDQNESVFIKERGLVSLPGFLYQSCIVHLDLGLGETDPGVAPKSFLWFLPW
eukprot:CAMPEP_0197269728 /NCGR_PEP_ID=MMETSP1432-20130617/5979_1 /TAXON_ID=44447 /ORGANISM="Pseudo-nitzschia delicatissima, Strain UNC1205" /LENGTH=303 /DNA_ID=CAMNT_0042734933 /DNA_START=26 /DNA_END=936 /DNA_ORIENTATION=+